MYFDVRYNRSTIVHVYVYMFAPWKTQIYFYSDNVCCIRVVESTVAKYKKNMYFGLVLAQVCWYRIYGREVKGVNLKVRIGDCHLVGTGETVGCMLLYEKYCKFKTYPLNQFIKCKYKIIK